MPSASDSNADRGALFRRRFLEGVEHFNKLEFWEAHESWEEIWLQAESDTEQFLQGLIQVAAAYHHIRRGTFSDAVRLFDAAFGRLEPFPPDHCGVDRPPLREIAEKHRDWVADLLARNAREERLPDSELPGIRLLSDFESRIPPRDDW
jgi:predicted metal-dependent hydrolase